MTDFVVRINNRSSVRLELEAGRLDGAGEAVAPTYIQAGQVYPISLSVPADNSLTLVYRGRERPTGGAIYRVAITCSNPQIGASSVRADALGTNLSTLSLQLVQSTNTDVWVHIHDGYHSRIRPSIGASMWAPHRCDVIGIGPDLDVVHSWIDETIPGAIIIDPDEVGRIPAFHRYESIQHVPARTRSVALCAWGVGRLDAAAIHELWGVSHVWFDGARFDSEPLQFPGAPGSAVAILAMEVGHLEVVIADASGSLHRRAYRAGGWEPWVNLGFVIPGGTLSAARLDEHSLSIFARLDDQLGLAELRLDTRTGQLEWPRPVVQGPTAPDVFAAASWAAGRTDLFSVPRLNPRLIEHRWREGVDSPWLAPEPLDPPDDVSALAATAITPGRLDLFACCWGEVVRHRYDNGWPKPPNVRWQMIPTGMAPPW